MQFSASTARATLDAFCVRCHGARTAAAGFRLDDIEPNNVGRDAEAWEKVLRRLRARLHPPMGVPQPNRSTVEGLIAFLELALDNAQRPPISVPAYDNRVESNFELASRLADFLWSSPPDDRLVQLAAAGQLSDPRYLEPEIKRMISDPKSRAFVTNFLGQIVMQPLLATLKPSPRFPDFDQGLRDAARRETELFLESQVAENQSALDLLTANYTFVNERLARHYGIPNISGEEFRRTL